MGKMVKEKSVLIGKDGYRYDYLFTDKGIVVITIISQKMYWIGFFSMLLIFALFTGYFGGIIMAVIAAGVLNLYASYIRDKNANKELNELLSKQENNIINWKSISGLEIKNNKLKFMVNDKTYNGKTDANTESIKKLLVLKLGKKVSKDF